MSSIKKYLEEKAYKSKMAEGDKKDDGMGVDEIDTDDYALDKNGKKHKAHKIVFNKGEDDGKQIGEELKGKQHKLDKNKNGKVDAHDFKLLRKEEQVDEAMTDAQMNKREDLVKGMKKNFKSFVDKYGKDRAENAMYATATKNAMKEEIEQIDELSKDTLKRYSDAAHKDFSKNFQHDQNFTGIHSAIRTAMAKTNSGTGGVHSLKGTKKNPLHKHDGVQAGLKTAADAVTAARAPFKHKMKVRNQGMDRADARLHKEETMNESADYHEKIADQHANHANQHEKEASNDGHPDHDYASVAHADAEKAHNAAAAAHKKHGADSSEYKKAAEHAKTATSNAKDESGHLRFRKVSKPAAIKESVFDWKNKARQTSDSSKTKTYHDVKKVSTGTVYTKQFDKDGVSKGTGDDAAKKAEGAAKRGRGRPKKDKFAEAVEFLMDLTEEQFDSVVEEGFDSFVESFLDEGKTGYAPGWMIKADPELKKKIDANKAKQKAMRQALGNPAAGKSTPANK